MGRDGSLLYVESYVSSTVREKQVQALKASGTADRKTPFSPPPKDIKKKSEKNHLSSYSGIIGMKKTECRFNEAL